MPAKRPKAVSRAGPSEPRPDLEALVGLGRPGGNPTVARYGGNIQPAWALMAANIPVQRRFGVTATLEEIARGKTGRTRAMVAARALWAIVMFEFSAYSWPEIEQQRLPGSARCHTTLFDSARNYAATGDPSAVEEARAAAMDQGWKRQRTIGARRADHGR